jgi:hypothetical protein
MKMGCQSRDTVDLPEPLMRRVKEIAVELNTTSSELVARVVESAVGNVGACGADALAENQEAINASFARLSERETSCRQVRRSRPGNPNLEPRMDANAHE